MAESFANFSAKFAGCAQRAKFREIPAGRPTGRPRWTRASQATRHLISSEDEQDVGTPREQWEMLLRYEDRQAWFEYRNTGQW